MGKDRPELTAEEVRRILDYDPETGVLTWKVKISNRVVVGNVAGYLSPEGYRLICIYSKRYLAHRIAWFHTTGVFPSDIIDHINGNPRDNRVCNLRLATVRENSQNQKRANRNNKLGVFGVSFNLGKYRAQIQSNGKVIHLGQYDTPEEAHEVYLAKKREIHPFFVESSEET